MFSPTKSDKSIHRVRNEPERQLGSLRGVIDSIRSDGGTPSVDSIATELSGMPSVQRASVLLALQQTHGNRYVQRVVTGIQAKLAVGQSGDIYEQEADRVPEQVMRMPEPQVQRQLEEEEEVEEERIQTKLPADQITPRVRRHVEEVEEEPEERGSLEASGYETTAQMPEATGTAVGERQTVPPSENFGESETTATEETLQSLAVEAASATQQTPSGVSSAEVETQNAGAGVDAQPGAEVSVPEGETLETEAPGGPSEAMVSVDQGTQPPAAVGDADSRPSRAEGSLLKGTNSLAPFMGAMAERLEAEAEEAARKVAEGKQVQVSASPGAPAVQFGLWSDIKGAVGRGLNWLMANVVTPIRRLVSSGWNAIRGFGSRIADAYREANATGRDIYNPTYLLFRVLRNLRRRLYAEAIAEQRGQRASAAPEGSLTAEAPSATEPTLLERADSVAETLEGGMESVLGVQRDIVEGAILGDFKENPSIWNTIGQIAIGFVPYAGQVADIRDLIASLKKIIFEGGYKSGWEWFNLVLVVIGFIPGVGDIIKAAGRGLKGVIRRGVRWVLRHGDNLWRAVARRVPALLRTARGFGRRLLNGAIRLGRRVLQGARSLGQRAVNAARIALQRARRFLGGVRQRVQRLARSVADRARQVVSRARGFLSRIAGAIAGAARRAINSARDLASRGVALVRRAMQRGREIVNNITRRVADGVRQAADFLRNAVRQAIDTGQRFLRNARQWASRAIRTAIQRGRQLATRGFNRVRNFIRNGIRWVRERAIPWVTQKLGNLKRRILNFLRRKWHRLKERAYRGLERLGIHRVDIGHAKPWNRMTRAEQRAFQHSYSRHAHEFGLPPWRQSNAEALRQQFNAQIASIRANAQRITVKYKPVGIMGGGVPGSSQPVRFFEYTNPSGVRYYYYETLNGKFVSAGLNRP